MNINCYKRPGGEARFIQQKHRTIDDIVQKETPKPFIVHAGTECHVTPLDVAERMAEYLGHVDRLLEPSAGTGNLILSAGYNKITAIELNYELGKIIKDRTSINTIQADFIEWNGGKFDGVLMNPPFSKVKKHVLRAFDMLVDGGSLVALVPITFDETAIGGEVLEVLPVDTFATCKVNTKIIMAIK